MIGSYTIDASIREVHTFESDVTEFPVEQGSPIADNIRPKPITVQIEGIVSNTPLPPISAGRSIVTDETDDSLPSVSALAALLAIRDAREPVTISTAVKSYDNMVLQSLEVPRDGTTGDALRFSATFVQVTIVTTTRATVRTTTVRTARPQDGKKTDFGKATIADIVPNGIYVVTLFQVQLAADTDNYQRFHYQDLYGPPILQDAYGLHYRVVDPNTTEPDGYIGQDNQYHQLAGTPAGTLATASGSYVPETAQGDLDSTATSYDPSTGTWTNAQGLPVSSSPPANVGAWKFPDP